LPDALHFRSAEDDAALDRFFEMEIVRRTTVSGDHERLEPGLLRRGVQDEEC
jgi:hypothetical protein